MTRPEPVWSDPGAEDLGGGVFRIPLPLPNDGLRAVNVYAICESDGIVLIDGGWALAESEEQLGQSLRSIGRDLDEVSQVLVTHVHRDHYTQAITIRDRYGSRVGLGNGEKANLAEIKNAITDRRPPLGNSVGLLRAGATDLVTRTHHQTAQEIDVWKDPDDWFTDGQHLSVGSRTLRAISTPGHTAGHLVYRDDAHNVLFAGDHVLPHITPSIGFEPAPVRWPLRDYLDSLILMKNEPDARLFPAHGPITASVHERVEELLQHHARRLDATQASVQAGASTGFEVAAMLLWTRREQAFDTFDLFNQRLAVNETAAHLDVLVLQGRLTSTTVAGVEHYDVAKTNPVSGDAAALRTTSAGE